MERVTDKSGNLVGYKVGGTLHKASPAQVAFDKGSQLKKSSSSGSGSSAKKTYFDQQLYNSEYQMYVDAGYSSEQASKFAQATATISTQPGTYSGYTKSQVLSSGSPSDVIQNLNTPEGRRQQQEAVRISNEERKKIITPPIDNARQKMNVINISQQTQDKINQYQQMQNQYYQKQLQQEVSKISNWNQLSNTIKQKYYERWNKKYNKTINTYANELIKKDLEKQHPGYEVKEVRTSKGITYKFIPKIPTREEGLEEGGAVFLTKDEVKFDEEVKEGALGSMVSPGQRTVHYAEYLMGMEPGSSEVVALGDYTKSKLDDEGGYTLIGRDGSKFYVDKSGKKTPIYSGGANAIIKGADYSGFKNKGALEVGKEIGKGMWTTTGGFLADVGRGFAQAGLYVVDLSATGTRMVIDKASGKAYTPFGEQIPSNQIPKNWKENIRYDFKTNPFKSPEYQSTLIALGLGTLIGVAPQSIPWVYKGAVGYHGYQFTKESTPEKLGELVGVAVLPKVAERIPKYIQNELTFYKIPKEYRGEYKALLKLEGVMKENLARFNINFNRVKDVPKEAIVPIKNVLRIDNNAFIGGTSAIETSGIRLLRNPRDLDIYTDVNRVSELVNKFANELGKYGINFVKRGNKIYIKGNKVLEVHGTDVAYGNIKSVAPFYRTIRSYVKTTPDGIKVIDPLILVKRKLRGGFEAKLERYSKDIPAYVQSIEQISELGGKGTMHKYQVERAKIVLKNFKDLLNVESKKPTPNREIVNAKVSEILREMNLFPNVWNKKGSYYGMFRNNINNFENTVLKKQLKKNDVEVMKKSMNKELSSVRDPNQKINIINKYSDYAKQKYNNLKFNYYSTPNKILKNTYKTEGKKTYSYLTNLQKIKNNYYKHIEKQNKGYGIPRKYSSSPTKIKYPGVSEVTTPSYPNIPTQPGYPGIPSSPSYPGVPEIPSTPSIAGFIPSSKKQPKRRVRKDLGPGYFVLSKPAGQTKYQVLNPNNPLPEKRAKDVGSYYVSNNLARTFKIKKANKPAQRDYQFMFIPEGFYESIKTQYRPYKIKKGKAIKPYQQFIQKSPFILQSPGEKRQIQQFRKQQEQFNKQIKAIQKRGSINTKRKLNSKSIFKL